MILVEASGVVWSHLGPSGIIWSHLEASGAIWGHLKPSGGIWVHLGPFGAIWGHLEQSEPPGLDPRRFTKRFCRQSYDTLDT